jgi:hypothetical protein
MKIFTSTFEICICCKKPLIKKLCIRIGDGDPFYDSSIAFIHIDCVPKFIKNLKRLHKKAIPKLIANSL